MRYLMILLTYDTGDDILYNFFFQKGFSLRNLFLKILESENRKVAFIVIFRLVRVKLKISYQMSHFAAISVSLCHTMTHCCFYYSLNKVLRISSIDIVFIC